MKKIILILVSFIILTTSSFSNAAMTKKECMASVKGSHEKMKCLLGRSDKLSGASTSTTASGEKKKFSFSGMLDKGFEKQRRSNEKIKEEMKK